MPNEEKREFKGRTEIVTSKANPKLSYCVSEKGAISIYGFGRFPWSPYLSQLEAVATGIDFELQPDCFMAEVIAFAREHEALLATPNSDVRKSDEKAETITLNSKDLEAVVAYANKIEATEPKIANRLMTIKSLAELNKFKVSPKMGFAVQSIRHLGKLPEDLEW